VSARVVETYAVPPGTHLWRPVGMGGSACDHCVLCGAVGGGLGVEPDKAADEPCTRVVRRIEYPDGDVHFRVKS
jgi:hypothetical protein